MEPLEARNLLTALTQARVRLVDDVDPVQFVGRPEIVDVSPDETLRAEVWVQDLRREDGDGNSDLHNFGIFASYSDMTFNADAFFVPAGTSRGHL
jgi:hypothetical protein